MESEPVQEQNIYVRVKPTEEVCDEYIQLHDDGQSITVKSLKKGKRSFLTHQISAYSFHVNSILTNTDQSALFSLTTKNALDQALAGKNGCIISNGGPLSGKTYSLNGPHNDYANRGLIPRAIAYIFQMQVHPFVNYLL